MDGHSVTLLHKTVFKTVLIITYSSTGTWWLHHRRNGSFFPEGWLDKRGEKTAVQAKCYANHNLVPVQTVRELVAAKRKHDCILTLLVTTSDLTGPAKKEAEQFRVEYWHGSIIEQKLRKWEEWRPTS